MTDTEHAKATRDATVNLREQIKLARLAGLTIELFDIEDWLQGKEGPLNNFLHISRKL